MATDPTSAEKILEAGASAIPVVGEVAKVLLGMYFEYMRQQGLSDAESERLYLETRLAFLNNDPSKIPNV